MDIFTPLRFSILVIISFLSIPALAKSSLEEDSTAAFFKDLESTLREDYLHCTGDSIRKPLDTLVAWKRQVDSLAKSGDYSQLARQFYRETGIIPGSVLPCDILAWKKDHNFQKQEMARILEEQKKREAQDRDDSIFVVQELLKAVSDPCDFKGIPFGVPKRCLRLMGIKSGMKLIDEGDHFTCNSINIGTFVTNAAFYLDKDGNYCRYELESTTGSLDSLDCCVRPRADSLAAFIEKKTGKSPMHIYRIGRFDIVQGNLAIYKMWNLQKTSVYIGLATYKYRYYAKAMVSAKNQKR